jgi:hypothetical protein
MSALCHKRTHALQQKDPRGLFARNTVRSLLSGFSVAPTWLCFDADQRRPLRSSGWIMSRVLTTLDAVSLEQSRLRPPESGLLLSVKPLKGGTNNDQVEGRVADAGR